MDHQTNETASKAREVYTALDPSLSRRKSLFTAYLLWLFGGFFGLHHFYLHRDRHAFITWATLAGYFGFGWLADLFKLPAYVRDCNEDVDYIEKLIKKMRKSEKPPVTWYRRAGSVIVANVFGYLLQAAIPTEHFEEESIYLRLIFMLVLPFSVALGEFWFVSMSISARVLRLKVQIGSC